MSFLEKVDYADSAAKEYSRKFLKGDCSTEWADGVAQNCVIESPRPAQPKTMFRVF